MTLNSPDHQRIHPVNTRCWGWTWGCLPPLIAILSAAGEMRTRADGGCVTVLSKGVAREGWQAGTSCTKLKRLATLSFLPDGTCLCSPVYTSCSNIKCNSGSFMACAAGNMASARCVLSHGFGTHKRVQRHNCLFGLRAANTPVCARSCSSTKKACLRRETGTWIQGWECAAVTTDVFVTNVEGCPWKTGHGCPNLFFWQWSCFSSL